MRKFIKAIGVAVAFSAIAVAVASATGPAMLTSATPTGTASNTGAISGNSATYPRHTFQVSGATVACNDASFDVTPVTTNTVHFKPTFSNCSLLVSNTPVGAAVIDVGCEWTLNFHAATYNTATGAGTGGSVNTNCSTTVTVAAIGCTIHVPGQTRAGITTQNITSTGAATAVAVPWGSTISGNVAGLTYTATAACPVPASGTGQYFGEVAARNVWGML